MQVTFWGTRGSIPAPLNGNAIKHKIRQALAGATGLNLSNPAIREEYLERLPLAIQSTVGGNTSCVQVYSGNRHLILDAGSGLRLLGLHLMQHFPTGGQQLHILMTHTHWDHIQGFPFFAPAFVPSNSIHFYSPFPDLYERLNRQQQATFFPVPLTAMTASITFHTLTEQEWTHIAGLRVYPLRLMHPGNSYAYRIEDEQTCLVYATDGEYKRANPASTAAYVELFQNADLLIFDAQYSLTEALDKADWGHSSALMGAEFARRACVKRLALFHHDPTSSDEKIWAARDQAAAYLMRHYSATGPQPPPICEVLVAYDGLHLTL